MKRPAKYGNIKTTVDGVRSDIERVRHLTKLGWSSDRIAEEYGVSASFVRKLRYAHGTRNNHNIVNEAQVREIRSLRKQGLSYREIGEKYGVSLHGIFNIINRKSWAWLA
jgi:transposase